MLNQLIVTALLLFFSGTTVIGQVLFKQVKSYEDEFGVRATDTLNSGLIIFKRAHPEEVIDVVEARTEDPRKSDYNVYFSYQYNFGYSKEKLLLEEWSYSIEQIEYGFLLVEQANFCLYDLKGKQLLDFETQKSPMRVDNLLIVKKEQESDLIHYYSLSTKEREKMAALYSLYDLSQKALKIFEDSLTRVDQLDSLLYLQNSSMPSQSKLVNKKMESVLPLNVYPEIILKECVIVRDSATQLSGLMDFNQKIMIPLEYEQFNVVQNPSIFSNRRYSYNDPEFWQSDEEDSLITAFRNDSSFLYNANYAMIFADKRFTFKEIKSPNKKNYLIVEIDKNEGVIDYEGRSIVPINYRKISLRNNFIEVQDPTQNYEHYLYSYDGTKLFNGPYSYIDRLPSGLVILRSFTEDGFNNNQFWLADPTTNTYINSDPYSKYLGSNEEILRFKKEDHYFFHALSGALLFSIQADYVDEFKDGKATVIIDKKEGAIDTKGQWMEELKRKKR